MKGTVAFMIMMQRFYFLELTSIDYDPGLIAEPFILNYLDGIKISLLPQAIDSKLNN